MNQTTCRSRCDCESKGERQLHITFEAFAGDLRRCGYPPIPWACMVEWWHTSDDGFCSSMSPHGRFAHPMLIGFSSSIYPDAIAFNLWSKASPVCRGALHNFWYFLRRERWIPDPPKRVPRLRTADRLLLEFDQHLDRVQGLAVVTRRARRRVGGELVFKRR